MSTPLYRRPPFRIGLVTALVAGAAASAVAARQTQPAARDAAHYAFRSSVDTTPPRPGVPVFRLSHDYPTRVPATCPECTWLQVGVDFSTSFPPATAGRGWYDGRWDEYMKRVFAYVKEGQDPQLSDSAGFRVRVGGKTRWFNVPWMAYDPTAGREYVHGTTNERTAHLSDLTRGPAPRRLGAGASRLAMVAGTQPRRGTSFLAGTTPDCQREFPHGFETWSVGYYNEYGGYTLGRAFPATGRPRLAMVQGSELLDGLPFPQGTVVVKILTTNAPVRCVPYLRGSPEWQINRHTMDSTNAYQCTRAVQVDRIVQVDVAVVDTLSPTRWVYSTYGYDGSRPGDTFWDRLVPLGVQWGADPWTFPAVPQAESQPLQQTVINPDNKLPEHLGCRGRLAGPVDNPQSSCMSCHASAFAARGGVPSTMGGNVPPSFGFGGMCTQYSLDNASYFQTIRVPQGFPGGKFPDAMTLDTSLQLEVAVGQYGQWNTYKAPLACTNPNQF